MVFHVRIQAAGEGGYLATCSDPVASARGQSAAQALERLREEIRYQIEVCPCASVEDDYVELQVG